MHPAGDAERHYGPVVLVEQAEGMIVPTMEVDSTDDSNEPNATYTLYIVNSKGKEIGTVFERWVFSASLGEEITYGRLEAFNLRHSPLRDQETYTRIGTNLAIQDALGLRDVASDTALGMLHLDVPAIDPTDPEAVGANSWAATDHAGIAASSFPHLISSAPIHVSNNDPRVSPTGTIPIHYPQTYGVVGDGIVDDTVAMQAFFDAMEDGFHAVLTPGMNIKNTGLTTPSGLQNFVMEGLGGAGEALGGMPRFTYVGVNGSTHIRWISNRGCVWRNILIDDRGVVSTDGPDKGIWFDQDGSGAISSNNTLDHVVLDPPVRSGYRAVNIDNTSGSNNEQHKINIIVNGLGVYGTALGTGVYLGHTNVKEVVIEHCSLLGLAKGIKGVGNPSFYSFDNNFTYTAIPFEGPFGDTVSSINDHSEQSTQVVVDSGSAPFTMITPRFSDLHGGQAASGTTSTDPIFAPGANSSLEVRGGLFQSISGGFTSNFILGPTTTACVTWKRNTVTGLSTADLITGLNTFAYAEHDVIGRGSINAPVGGLSLRGPLALAGTNTILSGATPDLAAGGSGIQYSTRYGFQNGGATTVTNFLNGYDGQVIVLLGDTLTTIQNNATIATASGADITPFNGKLVTFVLWGSVWRQQ